MQLSDAEITIINEGVKCHIDMWYNGYFPVIDIKCIAKYGQYIVNENLGDLSKLVSQQIINTINDMIKNDIKMEEFLLCKLTDFMAINEHMGCHPSLWYNSSGCLEFDHKVEKMLSTRKLIIYDHFKEH